MAGLSIGIGGGRSLGGGVAGGALGQTGGATIAQTAYGAGSTPVTGGGGVEHWHVFMGAQVAALAWLVFLRWSLPSGRKGGT
jgi:hypothetical protein